MSNYRIKQSKFLSYILRHGPGKYGLELDEKGYVGAEKVLDVLRERFKDFDKEELIEIVKQDPRGRFEITGGKIRATYGHSVEVSPVSENIIPPEILYHGTSAENAEVILAKGLKPMGRQFVHLSRDERDAYAVGLRHSRTPVILEIQAQKAALDNIKFYQEGTLFLAKHIPKEYISLRSSRS